jgi:hypothetical protein
MTFQYYRMQRYRKFLAEAGAEPTDENEEKAEDLTPRFRSESHRAMTLRVRIAAWDSRQAYTVQFDHWLTAWTFDLAVALSCL